MKITKRQLSRIIREEAKLLREHAYDVDKNELANMYSNMDAVDAVLGDLEAAGYVDLAMEVGQMIDYGDDDISTVLSVIPVQVKDGLMKR
tara:strand:+ start:171 stop:440 length:270 start_codon:yes stop_codon:yes gene_type:complete